MPPLPPPTPARDTVRLGVSSCLLGLKVRYDGQHKRDAFLVDTVGPLVQFLPVCPEAEVGMGIPRPTVRLVQVDGDVRMISESTGEDWTDRMRTWAAARVAALASQELDGYVLKRGSPSCGIAVVGLFAAELQRALPGLPLEEEGRLNDPALREAFFERVFAYRRRCGRPAPRWTIRDLAKA